jgi:hypothetical protein
MAVAIEESNKRIIEDHGLEGVRSIPRPFRQVAAQCADCDESPHMM